MLWFLASVNIIHILKSDSFVIKKPDDTHPRTKKALYSLRLRKIFSGVFVKEKMKEQLRFYKMWTLMLLASNDIVEQTLGQYGIICLEDVVREIDSVGPHFKEVTSFLCYHQARESFA
ncbi:hypothetical protein H5410_051721, partial [Solanum commersonii]